MRSAEYAFHRSNDPGLVVDDQNARGSHAYCSWGAASATGKATSIRVPEPGLLFTSMVPWTSQMMERQIDRPRPLPCGFVVKNGSSTRGRCCAGMPHPESMTESLIRPEA